jgi:hypothetical protein
MSTSQYHTEQGYREPSAVQFSVFLANRVGQLKDLLDLFHQRQTHILGLSIVDSTDWAVIRIVCSDPTAAERILREHGVSFTSSQVLLVELDEPDSMAAVCGHLLQAEINIHFAYPLAIRRHECAVMVLHVDDTLLACRILNNHGLTMLGDADLADPI